MILAVDVHYKAQTAVVAGVLFEQWSDRSEKAIYKSSLQSVKHYEPGQFYKRELPCIMKLITEHHLSPDFIVIDGYVYLDAQKRAGLGAHLHQALQGQVPIIGVAKNPFKGHSPAFELYRGQSKRPLYVTTAGLDLKEAHNYIRAMHGDHRLPTLLKLVDSACRESSHTNK